MKREAQRSRVFISGLLLFLFTGLSHHALAQYATGDYGAYVSGTWNTAATWKVYNGTSWASSPVASAAPNANNNVFILSGSTVTATYGTIYHCMNLTVENGGKLYNNDTGPTNLSYVSIYGSTLRCDGTIGNNGTLDGISFNIEGTSVTISGNGLFEAARLRKNFNANPVTLAALTSTSLFIDMDLTLRFSGGTNTMIYNNFNGSTTFNVTINPGRVVNLAGVAGAGNIAIDGVDGRGTGNRGGTFTVNGTLYIPGTLYLTTDNSSTAYNVAFTIGTTGYVRTNLINSDISGSGATPATHTLNILAGGVLEVTGTPVAWSAWNTTNNVFALNAASRFIYSGAGGQDVRPIPAPGYGHLRLQGTGTKALSGVTAIAGDLEIMNTTGSPVLDVTASNFQITLRGNWSNYNQSGFQERLGTVSFTNTTLPQWISTTGGEVFYNWTLSKSTVVPLVTMNSGVTVTNQLNLTTGVLELNGYMLSISNPATTAISGAFGTQRHIRSERTDNASRVRWFMGSTTGSHLIPFGGPSLYHPFTFNLVSGNADSVIVATYGTPASNLPWPSSPTVVTTLNNMSGVDNAAATVDRFWQVDVRGTTALAHLTFNYRASELPASPWNDPLSMRAQRWNAAAQAWEDQLENGGAAAYTATANNVSAFGPFTLTPLLSPLPVELIRFDARALGAKVGLEWETATELNSAWFVVQRSADLLEWSDVARVRAAGSSVMRHQYAATDDAPVTGWNYYRLVQLDQDGSRSISEVRPVFFGKAAAGSMRLYPNPAQGRVWLQLPVAASDDALRLRLLDAVGRVVLDERLPMTALQQVDASGIPAGSYTVWVEGPGLLEQARLVLE